MKICDTLQQSVLRVPIKFQVLKVPDILQDYFTQLVTYLLIEIHSILSNIFFRNIPFLFEDGSIFAKKDKFLLASIAT